MQQYWLVLGSKPLSCPNQGFTCKRSTYCLYLGELARG